ncbi:MAG: maleylacetoacetate isomerase [Xanthomonadales bacterium]|nr:maleylacetoacetate isomerase [Xanthomonadales bacterium]
MKLYSFWRSSAAYRVRIALHLKHIDYELVSKHLAQGQHRKADYLAANPQGLVPALEHRGVLFTQSLAIIEYLDSVVTEPRLLPQDPVDRAHVTAMAQAIASDIHPLNNLRVTNYLKQELGQGENAVQGWYAHWIQVGFRAMEAWAVQRSSSRRYLYADAVSLADLLLVPQMYNARRFKVSVEAFPALVAIDRHLCTLPAFIAASPERQPDMN